MINCWDLDFKKKAEELAERGLEFDLIDFDIGRHQTVCEDIAEAHGLTFCFDPSEPNIGHMRKKLRRLV